MGYSRIMSDLVDSEVEQEEVLLFEDAVTLIIRELSGFDRLNLLETDEWNEVYSECFEKRAKPYREKIANQLLEALRKGDISSSSYHCHEGILGETFETSTSEIYLSPWDLGRWLEDKGYHLSDYWDITLSELFLSIGARIGGHIQSARETMTACINIFKDDLDVMEAELFDKDSPSEDVYSRFDDFINERALSLIKYQDTHEQYPETAEVSERSKEAYLVLIGALVTVLAELDHDKKRPLPNKKLLLNGKRVSADGIRDVLLTRFAKDKYLKRANSKISEALKLIEDYK